METTQNRIWAKVCAFKQTIAAKIFGLALFLLLLTIGLAGFLLWEVARTEQNLEIVAHLDVPLTDSISSIHEFGLRRRLAFERWFGALNATAPNQERRRPTTIIYGQAHQRIRDRSRNDRILPGPDGLTQFAGRGEDGAGPDRAGRTRTRRKRN